MSVDERRKILRNVESEAKAFGFKISFVSLSEIFDDGISSVYDNCEEVPIQEDDMDKMKRIPTLSDRNELLRLHEYDIHTLFKNGSKDLGLFAGRLF